MAEHGLPSSSKSDNSADPASPQAGSSDITTVLADLSIDAEQRNAISDFVQATKESVSVAIDTLQDCQWDLLEAISRFGEDVEQEDEEGHDSSTPVIQPIRSQSTPRVREQPSTPSDHFRINALVRATQINGREHPRSFRSALTEPIAIERPPLAADTASVPMFVSPYGEKLWYTGFIAP